jgi:hypothetical protein
VLPPVARHAARHAFALAQRQTPYWRPGRDRGDYGDMRDVLDRFEPPRPKVPASA